MKDENLLDDIAPKRKQRVIKKKFHSNKGVSAETAARRQAAAEAAQENPLPREQKDAILMKYGVKDAVIERGIKMPSWKRDTIFQLSERSVETVWNHRMQDWYKETKGMVKSNSARVYHPTQPRTSNHRNWATIRFKDPQKQLEHERKFQRENLSNKPSSVPMDKSTRSPQS